MEEERQSAFSAFSAFLPGGPGEVNVDDNVIGRKAFQGILEERGLSRVPMLLVDETSFDDDPFISWFAGLPSVYRR